MTNSKTTRKALLSSVLALTMCVAMLIATTFAWFTDTASTAVNKIQAGNLDVALYYNSNTGEGDPVWKSAEGTEVLGWKQATDASGKTTIVAADGLPLWEPGCTFSLPEMKIVNEGNLALKYKIVISGITGNAKLLEAIDFTVMFNGADSTLEKLGEERQFLAGASNTFTISGHMKEDAGNEYQGLSISGIAITVYATQLNYEYDSEGNDYDKKALYDLKINESANGNLPVNKENSDNATVKTTTTISSGLVSVTYNENVKLKADTTVKGTDDKKATVAQGLNYVGNTLSGAASTVTINADTQAVASYELTLPVDDSNTVLVPVTINYEKGLTGVVVYHSGVALGTSSASLNVNGEYFTYDQTNGALVLYLKHASPIDVVFDKPGTVTVTSADELTTALGNTSITTVKLGSDITLSAIAKVTHNVTVDFNGNTLTAQGNWVTSGHKAIDVVACKLIFKDSSADKAGKFVSAYGGVQLWGETPAFELNDITIECAKSHAVTTGDNANTATAVMNSGKISGGAFNLSNYKTNRATVTINGGEINIGSPYDDKPGIYVGDSDVTINDGTFAGAGYPVLLSSSEDKKGKLIVNGGTFTLDPNGTLYSYGISRIMDWALSGSVKGGTFNVAPGNRVADGYKVVEETIDNATWYRVVKE